MGAVCCGLKDEGTKETAFDTSAAPGTLLPEENPSSEEREQNEPTNTEPSVLKQQETPSSSRTVAVAVDGADESTEESKPSAEKPVQAAKCSHGSALSPESEGFLKRTDALKELMKALQITMPGGVPLSVTVISFMEEPAVRPLVDKDLVATAITLATDKVKENETAVAQLLAEVARTLETCLQVGMDDFLRVMKAAQTKNPIRPAPAWFRKWNMEKLDVCSLRDVILYLAERIPCDCLQEEMAQAKKEPVRKLCDGCGKVETDREFLFCARCRTVRYCSKECQRASWKTHKISCRTMSLTA